VFLWVDGYLVALCELLVTACYLWKVNDVGKTAVFHFQRSILHFSKKSKPVKGYFKWNNPRSVVLFLKVHT